VNGDGAPSSREDGISNNRCGADHNIAGKTILLHAEQGFGDIIQFCRYVPLVAECAARVILEAPEPLHQLMGTLRVQG
jgi:hypothetical protein